MLRLYGKCFVREQHSHKTFAGEPATGYWRSATELRASVTNSDGGGIRTRDLPINSRSNPCLHHRQIVILVATLQTATQRSRQLKSSCARCRRLGARVGLAAKVSVPVSSQRWKQGPKRGTIDPGVVVRRSSLKLRHSRCRRDLACSPSRQCYARWVAGPAPTDRRCNPGLHHR
jgi:hypothetical protein